MHEAVEARPWRPEMGRRPRTTVYPYARRPRLRVRAAGAWRTATVTARHDWPDGRVVAQVEIRLPAPGGRWETYHRAYVWDADVMYVPRA